MSDNTISISAAYSFLAALTENNNDLYNHVYIPICKRALSYYNKKYGSKAGLWSDIKEIIQNEYGINVPQVIVKQLINSTYKAFSINEKRKAGFEIYNNGESFQLKKYTFIALEEKYERGIREANLLQEAFTAFLQTSDFFSDTIPSFYEFLEKNQKTVAAFFSNSEADILINRSYFNHFEFLKHIELKNHNLYKTAENQYIGSLLAGYFEAGLSLDPKFASKEIYYIDTSIALRALDLQREEETEAARELLNLISNTGGTVKILTITLDEIKKIIDNVINIYDNSTPTTTINEACIRLGKNKTWLISFASKLEENIKAGLNVAVEPLPPSFIAKFRNYKDVKELQATRVRQRNALHDVLSYMYIRQLRGNSIHSFQKAKIWFLTTNNELHKFNIKHLVGDIPEIVTADSLTSLLWLKNPSKLVNSIKKSGLGMLLATTYNEEFASRELISEFSNTIKSIEGISENEYRELLESIAHQSAKNIDSIIDVAKTDSSKAKAGMYGIIEKERARKHRINEDQLKAKSTIDSANAQNAALMEKLSKIEGKLSEIETSSKKKDEKLTIKEKRWKKIIVSLSILVVVLILIITNMIFSFVPYFINWAMGAGGLLPFGNFIINLINLLRKK